MPPTPQNICSSWPARTHEAPLELLASGVSASLVEPDASAKVEVESAPVENASPEPIELDEPVVEIVTSPSIGEQARGRQRRRTTGE